MKTKLTLLIFIFLGHFSAFSQIPPYVPTSGLVGWWPFTGNPVDVSGNGFDFTNNNAVSSADRFGNPNCSYYFNGVAGSPAFLDMPMNPLVANYTECSISFWFQRNSVSDSTWMMDMRSTGSPQIGAEFQSNDALFKFINYIHSPVDAPNFDIRDSIAISPNDWYHAVMTFDSLVTRLYIDGVLAGSCAASTFIIPQGGRWYVGKHAQSATIPALKAFDGWIDDIGLWSRALTPNEISGLYTGQIPQSCDSLFPANIYTNLIGYYPFCGNWNDYSGPNNDFTDQNSGVTFTTDRFGRSDNACFFNGSDSVAQYLVANTPLFNDTTSFSIAYWFERNPNIAPAGTWMMDMRSSTNPVYTFEFQSNDTILKFINYVKALNVTHYELRDSFSIDATGWHHVIVTSQRDTSRLYIDGVLVDEDTTHPIIPRGGKWRLGWNTAFQSPLTKSFNGKLDDIFVWNRALSVAEVNQVYSFNPVGVEERPQEASMLVYPNPADDHIIVELNRGFESLWGGRIRIYNVMGQVVYSTEIRQQKNRINFSPALSPGCYFVSVSGPDGVSLQVQKIILE